MCTPGSCHEWDIELGKSLFQLTICISCKYFQKSHLRNTDPASNSIFHWFLIPCLPHLPSSPSLCSCKFPSVLALTDYSDKLLQVPKLWPTYLDWESLSCKTNSVSSSFFHTAVMQTMTSCHIHCQNIHCQKSRNPTDECVSLVTNH